MIRWITWLTVVAAILVGCREKPVKEECPVKIEWHNASYGIEEYKRMNPGQPVLALFWSDRSLSGSTQQNIFEDDTSIAILSGSRFVCVRYDCSNPDSLGWKELMRHKQDSIPNGLFYDGATGDDKFFEIPQTTEEIYDLLRNLKILAEQVAASDR